MSTDFVTLTIVELPTTKRQRLNNLYVHRWGVVQADNNERACDRLEASFYLFIDALMYVVAATQQDVIDFTKTSGQAGKTHKDS